MKPSLVMFLCTASYTAAITLDEAYKRCKGIPRNELEPCIVNLIHDLKPLIQEGIKELGWDANDCHYDSVSVDQKGGMNHVKGHFHSATITGLEEFELTYLKIDYENRLAIWTVVIPEFVQKGRYNMDANILQFPLYGNGTFWNRAASVPIDIINDADAPGVWMGLHIYGVSKLEVVDINGKPHLQEKDTEITVSYRKTAMRLNNLFDGNSIMQEAASAFLNMNLDALYDELKASAKGTFQLFAGNHVNLALSRIRLDDLAGSEFIKEAFSIS